MARYSIALDLAHDEPTVEQAITMTIADLEFGADIAGEVLEEHGPGGGWPLVRFTGSRDAIRELIVDYTCGDLRDAFDIALDVARVD